jgi:hypothetical protein
MTTYCIVIYPLGGFDSPTCEPANLFKELIQACTTHTEAKPVVVVDAKTKWRSEGRGAELLSNLSDNINQVESLSVDTCQAWAAGWHYVLQRRPGPEDRIVLLPGDLQRVIDRAKFIKETLPNFIQAPKPDMLIGDFEVDRRTSGKALIDQYGIYPLLANWFPDVSKAIHDMELSKPRSEFLNLNAQVLRCLLTDYRSFAYEQTLNMIIRIATNPDKFACLSPDSRPTDWLRKFVRPFRLGTVADDSSARAFGGCIDQIERTDRLLRMVWRDIHSPTDDNKYPDFLREYASKQSTSSAIRNAAMIAIRALLGT